MNPPPTQTDTQPSETFFQDWFIRLEQLFHQLIQTQTQTQIPLLLETESGQKQLIAQVLTHYNDFFKAKSLITHRNTFLIISPPWLSSYERTFLWLAGLKPCLMFRLLNSSGVVFTADQASRMEALEAETSAGERQLEEQLLRVQEEVLAPPMLAMALAGKQVNGWVYDEDTAIERLMVSMEVLVARADQLREKTVLKMLEMLDVGQTVRFLAGVAHFQLNIRRFGMQ